MDYYQLLNVSPQADSKEIKQAYRQLAKKLHPDRNPGDKEAEAKFLQVSEAYQVLSDVEKRKLYDQQRMRQSNTQSAEHWTEQQTKTEDNSFSQEERERFYRATSDFEQFFGFRENGQKIKKATSKETLNAAAMFENYFTGKKRGK
ncbi:J domain-containing protein [Candidatus Enterococcus clewellii]|uniref:J domain-containing protein n=1 Tax=Candidatus Enterococcus clewellii TaxID=1834193 RepID=A0A242KD12_9ENTE|nr:DnaJ domain-containing protein [Enterococcus sp. 9E7_DIV0242]OTP19042.1 hypothetical protein A5888_000856 [Enterococcus sp. 9E7_DIV0242]